MDRKTWNELIKNSSKDVQEYWEKLTNTGVIYEVVNGKLILSIWPYPVDLSGSSIRVENGKVTFSEDIIESLNAIAKRAKTIIDTVPHKKVSIRTMADGPTWTEFCRMAGVDGDSSAGMKIFQAYNNLVQKAYEMADL